MLDEGLAPGVCDPGAGIRDLLVVELAGGLEWGVCCGGVWVGVGRGVGPPWFRPEELGGAELGRAEEEGVAGMGELGTSELGMPELGIPELGTSELGP